MIPLSYRGVAKAQVSQFIDSNGPGFYDSNQNSVLNTIAQFNSGASTVTFATEPTPVEYYEPADPAVNYPNVEFQD